MIQDQTSKTLPLTGRHGLYAITDKSSLSIRQTKKLIDSLDIIYGFDLAQVILLISKNKVSGYLNIISDKNEVYGVSFSEGDIAQIDNRDEKTFIGQLLVEDGYITEAELQEHLKNKSASLGQKLITSKKMTKDQLVAILLKQTILRLTQLINSKSIQVSFTHATVEVSEIKITYNQLVDLSFDWVFSCLTDQWLNMHYFEYKNNDIKLKNTQLAETYPEINNKLAELAQKNLSDIFEKKQKIRTLESKLSSKILFRIIHQLVLIDCIEFSLEEKTSLYENDVRTFFRELEKLSPVEKLNSLAVFTKSSANDVDSIYEKLVDKLQSLTIDPDLKTNILKMAMELLLNPQQIKQGENTIENSDKVITSIKNEAKDLIHNKKYFQAFTILKKLNESQMKASKIELYALWCLIGHAIDSNAKIEQSILKNRLSKIRPEDRYEAEYFYVLALYNKYLKKPAEAKQYYNKSCSMNPKFKDFKIDGDSFFSKIKTYFKFSILFFMFMTSQKLHSEVQTPPIKFTNQYYDYDVKNNEIHIAGLNIDTLHLATTISDLNLKKEKDTDCFSRKTENTILKICNLSAAAENSNSELKVFIANSVVPNSGSVIIQDIKEYIELKIQRDNLVILQFQTRRRPIVPYKIQKEALANKTHFTFLDLNNRKSIWNAELGVNELTFKLESINEPYRIFQDYTYASLNPEADEIDFTSKLPREVQFSYHRFGLNALAGFSNFQTSTSTFKSTLNSSVGKGIKFLYEYNLDQTTSLYTNLILYTAVVSDEQNFVVVANKNFTLLDYNLGYKIYYDLNWALSYEFNYRNNFSTKETSLGSNQFEVDQMYSYSLGVTPEYTLLEGRRWNFILEASPSLIFPLATAYGQSQIGYSWGLGLKTTYKLQAARVYAGLNYEDRNFKSADAKYINKDLIYSLGFYYLF